jgi:hypothetical protein
MLSALDGEDCGKRYLCELASMQPADLTQEERRTLAIFTVTLLINARLRLFSSSRNKLINQ